jgi:acyl-coenzyme A synthetase/AMP-(fatty) acid ligase
VELGDDGLYRFLGRRDNQIKSRGNRIELGDIEAALYSHPDVDECAVLAIPDDIVSNRLRAIVASKAPLVARDLTRFCAERLPRYMIPDAIDVVDTLPKTSTGKIDRQALMRAATTNEDR